MLQERMFTILPLLVIFAIAVKEYAAVGTTETPPHMRHSTSVAKGVQPKQFRQKEHVTPSLSNLWQTGTTIKISWVWQRHASSLADIFLRGSQRTELSQNQVHNTHAVKLMTLSEEGL